MGRHVIAGEFDGDADVTIDPGANVDSLEGATDAPAHPALPTDNAMASPTGNANRVFRPSPFMLPAPVRIVDEAT